MEISEKLVNQMMERIPNHENYTASYDYHNYSGRIGQKIYLHMDDEFKSFREITDAINWINEMESEYARHKRYKANNEILFRKFT